MIGKLDSPGAQTIPLNVADTVKVQWQAYLGPGAAARLQAA